MNNFIGYENEKESDGLVKQPENNGLSSSDKIIGEPTEGCSLNSSGHNHDNYHRAATERRYQNTKKRYVVFGCAFMHYFMVGGFNAMMGVIFVDIVRAFDTTRSEASLIQSLSRGFLFGGSVFGEILMRKLGVARCIVGASVLVSACLFASALAERMIMIVVLVGVGAGSGLMIPMLSTYLVIERAFDPLSFPKFMAYTIAGGGAGQIVLPYMAELMLSEYGWRGTFILMSGIFLNMVVFAVAIGFNLPEQRKLRTNKRKAIFDFSILKNSMFLTVLIIDVPFGISGFFESWYIPDYLVTIGYTREQGSILLTVVGAASTFGRLLAGFAHPICVFTKTKIIYHWTYLYLVLAGAHAMFPLFPNYHVLFPASILYGALYGMIRSQTSPVIVEGVGRLRYPVAVGLENTVYGIFSSIGGVVAGAIVDTTGSYKMVFYLAAIFSIACAVFAVGLLIMDITISKSKVKESKEIELTNL